MCILGKEFYGQKVQGKCKGEKGTTCLDQGSQFDSSRTKVERKLGQEMIPPEFSIGPHSCFHSKQKSAFGLT